MKPLKGVTVVDFSKVLAGPLCTQSLGDLGADIIKVEALGLGDETRGWPPFRRPGLGAVYLSVNRNKRSIALDLKSEKSREIVRRLIEKADVAIESFGTGVSERLGIDAKTLQAINPSLIHCEISGFGRSGPLAKAPGYDVILQAFGGMMALTGYENGPHIRSPISPIDQMAGTHALSGILAALYGRSANGDAGRTISVSLFETALGLQRYNLQSFFEKGTQPDRCGSSHESLCPYQAFEAKDGPIMIGVANDSQWRKFAPLIGRPELVDDPKFATNADRVANRAATLDIVQAALMTDTVQSWYDKLSAINVPCAPIYGLDQLMSHPHTEQSKMMVEYDHPHGGKIRSVGLPFLIDNQKNEPGLPPPLHGEHSSAILAELGYSEREIADLAAETVIQ